jgi:hypothetical protein
MPRRRWKKPSRGARSKAARPPTDDRAVASVAHHLASSTGSGSGSTLVRLRFGIVARADELVADERLLAAYASLFDARDDVTLSILDGMQDGELVAELAAAAERAGLSDDASADLVALASKSAEGERLVALGADAVYSRAGLGEAFTNLPVFDDGTAAQLRALAADAGSVGALSSSESQVEDAAPLLPLYEEEPGLIRSSLCSHAYMTTDSYAAWCARFKQQPSMHRKQWEWVIICDALHERGLLGPGKRGIGFGVGLEPLPALFASDGCEIVATDLALDNAASQGWVAGDQHAASLDQLNSLGLCPPDEFRERVSFRFADMNDIATDLRGFDFTWSSCCFEHLGSIEHGLTFVERSLDCLRPGGIAIHTTEFNLSSNDDTVDQGGTVIFRRQDIDRLAQRLTAQGHKICLDYTEGTTVYDRFVDLPPYQQDPHIRLLLSGYVSTSICLIVRKGG